MDTVAIPTKHSTTMRDTLIASPSTGLCGVVRAEGDKSLSHRGLIIASLALGTTRIRGLLAGEDVLATAEALRALGVMITPIADATYVTGVGLGGFVSPTQPLDLGNSGTSARLLAGVIAGSGVAATLCGDASLSARPMGRVIQPLTAMGATITARDGDRLPMHVNGHIGGHVNGDMAGTASPLSIDWVSEIASAQVKSAILLAGLTARGWTSVTEPTPSRNHTETMLAHFGADIETTTSADGSYTASVLGEAALTARDLDIGADPSSAAFLAVAALICADSEVTLKEVILNPLRFGLYTTLQEMGADIVITNKRTLGGEEVGDIICRTSRLSGITVPETRTATMIDEYPILAVAAAFAEGEVHMPNIAELRLKESDRIATMAAGLTQAGVQVKTTNDSMTIYGKGYGKGHGDKHSKGEKKPVAGGITIDARGDHRIAMAHAILGLASQQAVTIHGSSSIKTSFPDFTRLVQKLGGNIIEQESESNSDSLSNKGHPA
ncbi:MAG: 3-phosphoshikimate 1-carboxyvinyltransferase [Proteobacteria bacterium]|nr:3-phosphoshikimate 1-carboxyvinyltransferase [Pseudomonadota bacterium]